MKTKAAKATAKFWADQAKQNGDYTRSQLATFRTNLIADLEVMMANLEWIKIETRVVADQFLTDAASQSGISIADFPQHTSTTIKLQDRVVITQTGIDGTPQNIQLDC